METLIVGIVLSGLAFGASYLYSRLNKPSDPKPIRDDRQPTLSTQGSFVPLLLGQMKIAPIFLWDGGLTSRKREQGGKGQDDQFIGYSYRKSAIHALCLGVGDKLFRIWQAGKVVYEPDPPLSRDTTPSGSEIFVKGIGYFRIYWGEQNQPIIDPYFSDPKHWGVATRLPGIMHIDWNWKALGGSIVWPELQYEVSVPIYDSPLPSEANMVPTGPFPNPGAGNNTWGDSGVNPAHAMWSVLTARYPYGCGISPALLDGGSFEAAADIFADEYVPVNILATDGKDAAELLSEVLLEMGFYFVQKGGVLVLMPIRPDSNTVPDLPDDVIIDPDYSMSMAHGETAPSRFSYMVKDRLNGYKPSSVSLPDDATARMFGRVKPQQVMINHVTDKRTGYTIAQRRYNDESAVPQALTLKATRGARSLVPGQLFNIPAIGRLRCTSIKPAIDSTGVEVKATLDTYGRVAGTYLPPGTPSTTSVLAQPDIVVIAQELSNKIAGPYPAIGVARIRANQAIVGASVWFSVGGASYIQVGLQDAYAAGGTLNRPMTEVDVGEVDGVIEDGPTITSFNTDIDEVLDLTGNDAAYEAGVQVCVIDDEWFFIRGVEAVSGGYKLKGLKRAQYATIAADHDVNSIVVIFQPATQTIFQGGLVQHGATVSVKTQPRTVDQTVDLSVVTPVSVVVP